MNMPVEAKQAKVHKALVMYAEPGQKLFPAGGKLLKLKVQDFRHRDVPKKTGVYN